ncbi:ABC transporter type 1, transmembrane domain-containing protein, partial [Obelidium mucronatum]
MMAADTTHIQWFIMMIYNPIGIPAKIALCLYLLWQQVGVACIGGLAVIILALPVQAVIGKLMRRVYSSKQKAGDQRIEIVNESLTSIKLLKLYGWDIIFHKRVTDARNLELKSIKSIGVLKSFNSLVGTVTPLFVSLVSFAIYSAINNGTGQGLTASKIFVSLSLFNILSEPIRAVGNLFSGGSAAVVSLNRI